MAFAPKVAGVFSGLSGSPHAAGQSAGTAGILNAAGSSIRWVGSPPTLSVDDSCRSTWGIGPQLYRSAHGIHATICFCRVGARFGRRAARGAGVRTEASSRRPTDCVSICTWLIDWQFDSEPGAHTVIVAYTMLGMGAITL